MAADDRVVTVTRFSPGISRQQIADRLGLGVTTVSPLVARLLERGVLREEVPENLDDSAAPRGRGRRPTTLHVAGRVDTLGVIVWGHGELDIALVTFGGEVVWRRTTPEPERPDAPGVIAAADDVLAAGAGIDGFRRPICLVLAVPAPYERGVGLPAGGPSGEPVVVDGPGAFADWFGTDPRRLLADRFDVPAVVVNDANLAVLGEVRSGAAVDARVALYIRLSMNGLGAGLTVDGDLVEGGRGFAGELSHVQIDPESDRLCICGSRGCLRDQVGPGLLDSLRELYGDDLDYAGLLRLADEDAPAAVRTLHDAGRTLGRSLSALCTFLNPDALVLDAGSRRASALVLEGIDEQLGRAVPPFIRQGLRLAPAALGSDSVLAGAVQVARAAATTAGLGR